jgi:hypothetical protein
MHIKPELKLLCKLCGWRPDDDKTVGEFQRHMIEAHKIEGVTLDLSAICICGSEMTFRFTEQVGEGDTVRDHFMCPRDRNEGWIDRHPKPE